MNGKALHKYMGEKTDDDFPFKIHRKIYFTMYFFVCWRVESGEYSIGILNNCSAFEVP